jgi:hypothetical protein
MVSTGQIARLTRYDAVTPGGCCEPGKRSEDLRCMPLHTLLLLLQAGPDVRYNPLPPT